MKPFAYIIEHLPSNKFYVGSKYSRDADPDQLWTTYFTSSRVVEKLVKQDGKESFRIISVEPQPSREAALEREAVLQLMFDRTQLLNRRLANSSFNTFGPFSEEHCRKISVSKKGMPLLGQRGKRKSPESVAKMAATKTGQPYRGDRIAMGLKVSAALSGRKKTEEHRRRLSETKTGKTLGPQSPEHLAKRVASWRATVMEHGLPLKVTSAETRELQRVGKLRTSRVKCASCERLVTPQNIRRHETACKGKL